MRALSKVEKPMVLRKNEDQWTREYLDAVQAGDTSGKERWRHVEIKRTLNKEVEGKCAYCEAFVEDVSYPHVEHILPKSVKPELAHKWENLTSACSRCNVAKGTELGLLNPYVDELDQHLIFLGDLINWELGSERGEFTVRRLDLNRLELINARVRRLGAIRELLERWHRANEPLKTTLEEALKLDAREGEFSRSVSAYLRSFKFPM